MGTPWWRRSAQTPVSHPLPEPVGLSWRYSGLCLFLSADRTMWWTCAWILLLCNLKGLINSLRVLLLTACDSEWVRVEFTSWSKVFKVAVIFKRWHCCCSVLRHRSEWNTGSCKLDPSVIRSTWRNHKLNQESIRLHTLAVWVLSSSLRLEVSCFLLVVVLLTVWLLWCHKHKHCICVV